MLEVENQSEVKISSSGKTPQQMLEDAMIHAVPSLVTGLLKHLTEIRDESDLTYCAIAQEDDEVL